MNYNALMHPKRKGDMEEKKARVRDTIWRDYEVERKSKNNKSFGYKT